MVGDYIHSVDIDHYQAAKDIERLRRIKKRMERNHLNTIQENVQLAVKAKEIIKRRKLSNAEKSVS